MNKNLMILSLISLVLNLFPLQADDVLVNNQLNVSSNSQFIAIGVNGYYSADTETNNGADAYFDVGQLRNFGPKGNGYTNISSFMFSDPGSSDGSDYVRQLGDFNCNPDNFIRKDNNGTHVIVTSDSNGQNFISMAKLEWVYRNTEIFFSELSPAYIPGQDGANRDQGDSSITLLIRSLIAQGPQYRELLAVGPGALADQLARQIASGALSYDQINQTYGSQLKLTKLEREMEGLLKFSASGVTWTSQGYADLVIALWIRAWEAPNDIRFFAHSMGGGRHAVPFRIVQSGYLRP